MIIFLILVLLLSPAMTPNSLLIESTESVVENVLSRHTKVISVRKPVLPLLKSTTAAVEPVKKSKVTGFDHNVVKTIISPPFYITFRKLLI